MATKSKARVATKTSAPVIMHEKMHGVHRIVRIVPGHPAVGGEWVHEKDVAKLDSLRATTEHGHADLPRGVFRTTGVEHMVL